MPSLFTRIIDGELPGRFVYQDPQVVAFLTINPLRPGHTLVVPRVEVDDWLDLDTSSRHSLFEASYFLGAAIKQAFPCRKIAVLLLGLEVPHVHVHLVPIDTEDQIDLALAERSPDPAALDEAQARIRAALA